ncbi:MAG TPA: hypothetical protein PL048_10180 [Leptospiraceae bacterium]|nr:hypothetical protein [Leptospiraceae bacterium]HMZ59134.1 hypothetical protein [Leptospiraceae bacterium]HNF12193.1 hypothetical protein [Leptospiraceae bacterium]HNF25349.1 hypothetical protein [Leptospiraceae bacterium]HNH11028.1 hypothetical protein [Leptospiraceae bacterium]
MKKSSVAVKERKKRVNWSDRLKLQTKEVLYDLPVSAFLPGYCCMKSSEHQFGIIRLEDALRNAYIIRSRDSGEIIREFTDVVSLISAGWVVD